MTAEQRRSVVLGAMAATFVLAFVAFGLWRFTHRPTPTPMPDTVVAQGVPLGWMVMLGVVLVVFRLAFALGRKRQRAAHAIKFWKGMPR